MGHDISGFNKAGDEIAYARFSMGNHNAFVLYNLLNANDYYAGASGSGDDSTISVQQIEKALNEFNQIYNNVSSRSKSAFLAWDQKQIHDFIINCLATAQKEGSVKVLFA